MTIDETISRATMCLAGVNPLALDRLFRGNHEELFFWRALIDERRAMESALVLAAETMVAMQEELVGLRKERIDRGVDAMEINGGKDE